MTNEMLSFETETALYPSICALFDKHPYTFSEIPFRRKRVDLLFTGTSLRSFHTVEAKLKDWRKAFKQATVNQLFAQYSYVAFPKSLVDRFNGGHWELFSDNSVGVIEIGHSSCIRLRATRSAYFRLSSFWEVKPSLLAALESHKARNLRIIADGVSKRSRTLELLQARTD